MRGPSLAIGLTRNCHIATCKAAFLGAFEVAAFFDQSLRWCEAGHMPTKQLDGRPFPAGSLQGKLAGCRMPSGLRACYFNMKFDYKERIETHNFTQNYHCTLLCDSCMAQKAAKHCDPEMNFTDFRPDAPYSFTTITHEMYTKYFRQASRIIRAFTTLQSP